MKYLLIYTILILTSCEPEWDFYQRYLIQEGDHDSELRIEQLQNSSLSFYAKFDSSAIYISNTLENQWDTNKLMGFSDCNSKHHDNSARFGWRWLNDELDIMAYVYNDGERIIEKIGVAKIGQANYYDIQITSDSYLFNFNGNSISIKRGQTCDQGAYYLLFPYFGGDEVAPHNISIYIKRIY
jgi:hypothetical protein